MMRILIVCVAAVAAFGCEREANAPAASVALPVGLLLAEPPAGAVDVIAARGSAKEGETVVIKGVVGGRAEPIAPNRAIFTAIDHTLETCDKRQDDACKSPWDACCEPPEKITGSMATIQVVDPSGQPLKTTLLGAGRLAPGKSVVVTGTARRPPNAGDTLIIDATGIYVGN
jgi:hypothetical protein